MNREISDMRENYTRGHLLETDLRDNPYGQFKMWLDNAIASNVYEANAMTLSTVSQSGRPSSRVVLLKDVDEDGLVFYTNYESRKGKEMKSTPFAALNFFWKEMERQVRIEGSVSKVSRSRSEAYFHSRPYGSQVGALSSLQSQRLDEREVLDERYAANYERYKVDGKVPLPENWGGYKLSADYFEFWQGRTSRLHDRMEYRLEKGEWSVARLEP